MQKYVKEKKEKMNFLLYSATWLRWLNSSKWIEHLSSWLSEFPLVTLSLFKSQPSTPTQFRSLQNKTNNKASRCNNPLFPLLITFSLYVCACVWNRYKSSKEYVLLVSARIMHWWLKTISFWREFILLPYQCCYRLPYFSPPKPSLKIF